jgi:Malic enzyme, NAD binding domain
MSFGHTFFSDVNHATVGAVVLSGFFNAARLASEASGKPLTDHRILFFGAGSAGIGVAKQLLSFFTLLGMSEEDAKKRIYVGCFVSPSLERLRCPSDGGFKRSDHCRSERPTGT